MKKKKKKKKKLERETNLCLDEQEFRDGERFVFTFGSNLQK